jgi:hypothetical protein
VVRWSSGAAVDDASTEMARIVRNVVLHLISAGMLAAAIATPDPYWHNMALAFAAGAFVLAWMTFD